MARSYTVRFAKDSEREQIEQLWAYCFHKDSEPFRKWYFSNYYRHKECLVAIGVDGQIYASLQLVEQTIEDNETNAIKTGAYIVGVDVLPEERDAHLARALMLEAERYAESKAYDFLMLMPFEAGFYQAFGYTFVDFHLHHKLSLNELKRASYTGQFIKANLEDAPYSSLKKVYDAYQEKHFRYSLVRGKRHFEALSNDVLLEGGYLYLYYQDDECLGYMFYTVGESFYIRELIALNEEAYAAFFSFVKSHQSQVAGFEWSAPMNTALAYSRSVDKMGVALYPFMMAKVFNYQSWLDLDSLENSKLSFDLILKNGERKRLSVNEKEAQGKDADFELSEEQFTKLIFGRHGIEPIVPIQCLNKAKWRAFEASFKMGFVYFNEYF